MSLAIVMLPNIAATQSGRPHDSGRSAGPSFELTAHVLHSDGTPGGGLEVDLFDWQESRRFGSLLRVVEPVEQGQGLRVGRSITDEQGRFRFTDLPYGQYEVAVDVGGARATSWLVRGLCTTGPTDLAELRLRSERSVTGRVTAGTGAPIAGARVRAAEASPEWFRSVGLLGFGPDAVPASHDHRESWTTYELPFWMSSYLDRLHVPTASTGTDGTFELFLHPSESASVLVDAPGFAPEAIALGPGSKEPLTIELTRQRPFDLRVLTSEGDPAVGVEVVAAGEAPLLHASVNLPSWGRTNANGRVEIGIERGQPGAHRIAGPARRPTRRVGVPVRASDDCRR